MRREELRPARPAPLRIVGIGGGTGLAVLLSGLDRLAREAKSGTTPVEVSAIVSVADDGGSTGHLRRHLGIPAVGDLRNCLVALSRGNPLWGELFQHRFAGGNGLSGHSLGNLIMAALIERSGSLKAAVERLAQPLGLFGRVLPVSEDSVVLCAALDDGRVVRGESRIPLAGRPISRLWLEPAAAPAPGVLEALGAADVIVLGPGSLYTSIVPNLLVGGVATAIRRARALRVFVCNVMSQPGETDGFDVADHLEAVERQLGGPAIDVCIADSSRLPRRIVERYAAHGASPVALVQRPPIGRVRPVTGDFLDRDSGLGRHDPARLAATILDLAGRSGRRHEAATAPTSGTALVDPPESGALAVCGE